MQIFKDGKSLGFLIVEVSRLMRKILIPKSVTSVFRPHNGLYWCMRAAKMDSVRLELAERIEIEQPTLVRHLDNLEEQGLVERRQDPIDRRSKRIFMKDTCHPLIKALEEKAIEARKMVLSGVSEKDIELAFSVLERIKSNLLEYNQLHMKESTS